MPIEVKVPTILRTYTGGDRAVSGAGGTLGEAYVLLGHLAVDDAERAQRKRGLALMAAVGRGHQHVVGVGLLGERDVGA